MFPYYQNLKVSVSVADPDPGSGASLPHESRIRIRDKCLTDFGSGTSSVRFSYFVFRIIVLFIFLKLPVVYYYQ
jgi:hypothetical protein